MYKFTMTVNQYFCFKLH